jgi:hypothetical protein
VLRRRGSGGRSTWSSTMRSTGCSSSRDSPSAGVGELIVGGGGRGGERRWACSPREVESSTPITTGRGGGRGSSACGRRGGACCRVVGGGAHGCREGTGKRDGGTPEPSRKRKRGFSNLR